MDGNSDAEALHGHHQAEGGASTDAGDARTLEHEGLGAGDDAAIENTSDTQADAKQGEVVGTITNNKENGGDKAGDEDHPLVILVADLADDDGQEDVSGGGAEVVAHTGVTGDGLVNGPVGIHLEDVVAIGAACVDQAQEEGVGDDHAPHIGVLQNADDVLPQAVLAFLDGGGGQSSVHTGAVFGKDPPANHQDENDDTGDHE